MWPRSPMLTDVAQVYLAFRRVRTLHVVDVGNLRRGPVQPTKLQTRQRVPVGTAGVFVRCYVGRASVHCRGSGRRCRRRILVRYSFTLHIARSPAAFCRLSARRTRVLVFTKIFRRIRVPVGTPAVFVRRFTELNERVRCRGSGHVDATGRFSYDAPCNSYTFTLRSAQLRATFCQPLNARDSRTVFNSFRKRDCARPVQGHGSGCSKKSHRANQWDRHSARTWRELI